VKGDLEAETVKQEFRRRWIRQLVVTLIALAALALSGAFTRNAGVDSGPIPPYLLVAIVIGLLIFSLVNWRCPACNRYLYRDIYPRHCSGCGTQLR
jgi:hypothetical protein